MVNLMEINDKDDLMERVNLDDYDSDDFKEYLSDDNMQAAHSTAEAKANPNYAAFLPSSPSNHDYRQS